ncbi:MAG: type II toxin-antitoxin system RelE/ParE family toxin [Acidobacteria bacterium]|nr:type II toxin-antitoxin system RelE/ParE family toxin [Acidobacteriota bacterium]
MNRLVISPQAKTDLLNLWAFAFYDDGQAADRLIEEFTAKFDTLLAFSEIGRSREDLGAGLRSFPLQRLVIFYRLIADGIEIFRVLQGRQNFEALFSE